MAITYVGKSSFASGTAALSVGAVSGVAAGDLLLLFVESANQPVAAPSGYTQVTNSPVAIGTAAAAGGVALQVFYRIATGADTTTTVAGSGDHTTAIKMAFRGVSTSTPFDATPVSGTKTTASTSSSYPGITTATANAMVVYASALDLDAASTATTSSQANANLTSITERHDQTVTSGFGGGLVITTGMKATAGATGNLTATVTSTTQVYLTLALRPAPITGDLAVSEAYSQRDTAKLYQSGTTWPATGAGDEKYPGVKALLHMDGAEGSTTFTDVLGNSVSRYGAAAVTTSPAKFGGALNLPTSNTNSALFVNGLSLTPSLTLDFWLYIPSSVDVSSSPMDLITGSSANSNAYIVVRLDTDGFLRCSAKSGSFLVGSYAETHTVTASDAAISRDTWHHVAFYVGGYSVLQGFLDGVKSSTDSTFGLTMPDDVLQLRLVGRGCFYDDFRVTWGQRYPATGYSVPTAPAPEQGATPGPAAAQATLTGTLTSLVSAALGAGITASAALAAALTTSAPVAATLPAGATLSPALTTSIRPAAGLAASSALSASLSTAKPLTAALGAQAGLSGLLQSQAAALQATTVASATLSGGLTTARLIQASLGASSAVSAALTAQIRAAAGLQASPALSGALTTQVRLASVLAGQGSVTAALGTQISAQAAMVAQSALTGDLSGAAAQLTTQLQCAPGLTATLQATLPLQAVLTARSTLTLVVGSAVPLQALVAARALAVGALAPTARSARGWLVPAQVRGWGVPAQVRTWALPAQGPVYQVPAQERSWGVPAQERITEVQGEARMFVVPSS